MSNIYIADCVVSVENDTFTLCEFIEANETLSALETLTLVSNLFRYNVAYLHASVDDKIEIKLVHIERDA